MMQPRKDARYSPRRGRTAAWMVVAAVAAILTGHTILAQQPLPLPLPAQGTAPPKPVTSGAPVAPVAPLAAPAGQPAAEPGDAATTLSGDRIIVRREAIALIDPRTYRIGFHLEPHQQLDVIAPQDGYVSAVQVKVNDRVETQYELLRFDDRLAKLKLDRSRAGQRVAELKFKGVESSSNEAERDLTQAELEIANAEHEIAKYQFDLAVVRAPFGGEVIDVRVVPGQFVRAGDRLLTIADTSRLRVQVPWGRTDEIAPGKTVPLKVEDQTVDALIESVKPLAEPFSKLRDLANSVTSLELVVANPTRDGRSAHFVGQSVFPPLIPRHDVTEIPTRAVLGDRETGERKVQVLRDLSIRDVPVQILGSVGPDRVFVSGPFEGDDELILETSVELADGTQLRPFVSDIAAAESSAQAPAGTAPQQPAKRLTPGF